jgi:Uma2 family endonuclease
MATAEVQKRYTPEDLLTMPDRDDYELVDGQLVERKKMSTWACYVAGSLCSRLANFSQANQPGWVLPDGNTYQCFPDDPNRVRRADASFIRRERMTLEQATARGHTRVNPDLAVEVMSPNDLAYDVDEKVQEWLGAGASLVWVINPRTRTVRVHRAEGSGTILREHDYLDGEDVLPGFRCQVKELFEPPAGVAANA